MAMFTSFRLLAILPLILSFFLFRNTVPEFDLRSPPCTTLSLLLGKKVSYPGNAVYATSLTSYFSAQAASLSPSCIVAPESSADVATAVKTLAFWSKWNVKQCQFAIRSGGHTPAAGAANIDQGVVIDLRLLNQVVVNEEKTVASVGPGAKWGDVYMKLDEIELSVVGGRVFDVGVGGLMTGGGMSFFSPRYGWGCDNVENYEVVLASGEIVNANKDEHPDLWTALKGGSNNFGVVTRFDLKTFKQGKMWGGFVLAGPEALPKSLDAFADFAGSSDYDEGSALIHAVSLGVHGSFVAASPQYTKEEANPAVFKPWIDMQPQVHNTLRVTNLSDLALEQSKMSPSGSRQFWITTTFKHDRAFEQRVVDLYHASMPAILNATGLAISLVFQPLPVAINAKSSPKGGNSLGFDSSDGPLVICQLVATYPLEIDDERIAKVGAELFDKIDGEAKAAEVFHPFKYLNYVSKEQDPIKGYGQESFTKLSEASVKYDPQGIFQKCVPGGFKLFTKRDW